MKHYSISQYVTLKQITGASLIALAAGSQSVAQDDAFSLEEIVVTAQKRSESLQDVPVSISAISAGDIAGQKLRDAGEIAALVPNLQVTDPTGDGFPIFALRGVSMSDFSLNQSSPVASYVDEVYKGSPAIQGVQIFDLERIEVLRGPQGTLYGKNSTGGAVNFITRKPTFDSDGYVTAGYGNYDRMELSGAVQTPLIDDKLAVRIAGTWTQADGWMSNLNAGFNDGGAIDEYGLRATFLFQPSETFEAVLRLATGKQHAANYGIVPFNISPDGAGGGVYGLYNLLGASDVVDYTRGDAEWSDFAGGRNDKRRIKTDSVTLTMNWDVSDTLGFTSITSWDEGSFYNPEDADGTPLAIIDADYFGETEQFTQDTRITSNLSGPFNFIAGLYYAKEETYNQTTLAFYQDVDFNADGALNYLDCLDTLYTTFGLGQATAEGAGVEAVLNSFDLSLAAFFPGGCQAQNDFNQDRISKAAYFDGSYDLSEQLTLRFGVRYTEDETKLSDFSARILGNDDTPLLNAIPYDEADPFATAPNDSFKDSEWTGKVGLDYTTDSGTLYYASFSKGYRNGAYNAQAFFDPAELTRVAPEKLDSFEVGFKARLADNRVQLNGSAFSYSYKNQQFLNVDSATAAQTLINIDKSSVMGMELEMVAQVTPTLRLHAGVGLLDTEVKEGTLSGVDLAGNSLVLAPSVNLNGAIQWDFLTTDSGMATLKLDAAHTGSHHFDIFNTDRLKQDGYTLFGARTEWTSTNERWSAGLWVKNLFDTEYRTSVLDLAAFGYDYSHIGRSRTYGVDVTLRF